MNKIPGLIAVAVVALSTSASYASPAQVWRIPVPLGTFDQPTEWIARPPVHLRSCDQVFYGTGYHGCGTASGGPSGGLPNRN